jgi:hypothetical protein
MTADNNDPFEAQALTLSEIMKISETDSKAADAALQRAREASEAEAASDIDVESLLGDLELGPDESAGEVIEHLGELDAAGEDAPINEIKREKAEPAAAKQVDGAEIDDGELAARDEARKEPNKLRKQMHAKLAEINGGVRVAPDDPLATDKICVHRYLKKFGLTSDDLPDGFWDEPDEIVRGWLLGDVVGPVMARRRYEKRVERSIEAGYPADYYSRPWDEQRKIGSVVRKRRWRAEQATKLAPTPKAPLPTTKITKEWITDSFTRLKSWTADSDPMAIQLRSREKEFVHARNAYQRLINTLGRAPKQSELADELGCTRRVAQNKIDKLRKLEGVGGPWHEKR